MATPTYNDPLAGTRYQSLIWSNLIHLSYNMWSDRVSPEKDGGGNYAKPYLRFDETLWNDVLQRMKAAGMNMVILDLGDGVLYQSHPEIAVENAWTTGHLREEIAKMRALGLEPIPKLNFSTGHDAWLKDYSRMVSTPRYYEVCADLIRECCELFETPRFFHLGMDEETFGNQREFAYAVVRQHELWWHDLNLLCQEVEKAGARPWVWSDKLWHHYDEFLAQMPKNVVQSNWYYGNQLGPHPTPEQKKGWPMEKQGAKSYITLEEHGYDQIPTGSNWATDTNFEETVAYCVKQIAPERLLGFMTAPWAPTVERRRDKHMIAIAQVEAAISALRASDAAP